MKPITLLAASLILLFMVSSAHAERWTCTYDGVWITTKTSNQGKFTWSVSWIKSDKGWHVVGDYKDKYGNSKLDGDCAQKACLFKQSYVDGQLKGKVYYWKGSYADRWDGTSKTINQFTGTWGYNAQAANGGPWNATAICVKEASKPLLKK